MSVTKTVTIHCDCCSQWTDGATHSQSVFEARRAAKADGWHYVNPSVDLCPLCWSLGHRPPWRNGVCFPRAEGSSDDQSRRAVNAEAPQPTNDSVVADRPTL